MPPQVLESGFISLDGVETHRVDQVHHDHLTNQLEVQTQLTPFQWPFTKWQGIRTRQRRAIAAATFHLNLLVVADETMTEYYQHDDLILYLLAVFHDVQRVFWYPFGR